jgi:sugar phosphate isomerase/epimerase
MQRSLTLSLAPADRAALDRLSQALISTSLTLETAMSELKDTADAVLAESKKAAAYIVSLADQLLAAIASNDPAERDAVIAELKEAVATLAQVDTPTVAAGAGSSDTSAS